MTAKTWFILSISVLCWFSVLANGNHLQPTKTNKINLINNYFQHPNGDDDSHQTSNLTNRILFPFFNENKARNTGNLDNYNNDSNDEEDGEYLADLDNTKPFISPLENFPIIGNLITGKKLDFSSYTANTQQKSTSSSTRSDLQNTGFNIAIRNTTTVAGAVGKIESLPSNAQSDLEDPVAVEVEAAPKNTPPHTEQLNNNKTIIHNIANSNNTGTVAASSHKKAQFNKSNKNNNTNNSNASNKNAKTKSYWKANNTTNSNNNNSVNNNITTNISKNTSTSHEKANISSNNNNNKATTISYWKVNNSTTTTNGNNNKNTNTGTSYHGKAQIDLRKQGASITNKINNIHNNNNNNNNNNNSTKAQLVLSKSQNTLTPSSIIHNLMTDTSLEKLIKHQHNQSDDIRILYARPNLVHQTPNGNLTLVDQHHVSQVSGMIQKSNKTQSPTTMKSPDNHYDTETTNTNRPYQMNPVGTIQKSNKETSKTNEMLSNNNTVHNKNTASFLNKTYPQQMTSKTDKQQQKQQQITKTKGQKTSEQTNMIDKIKTTKTDLQTTSKIDKTNLQQQQQLPKWSSLQNGTSKAQTQFKPNQISTKLLIPSSLPSTTKTNTTKHFNNTDLSQKSSKKQTTTNSSSSITWHPIADTVTTQRKQTKKEHTNMLSPSPGVATFKKVGKQGPKPSKEHRLSSHEITFKAKDKLDSQAMDNKHSQQQSELMDSQRNSKQPSEQPKINKKITEKERNMKKQPITIEEKRNNKIQFVQLSRDNNSNNSTNQQDAKCMDGSPPAYYIRHGYGNGQDKWIIHLHGGAWCYDLQSCSKRRSSILGSTKRSLEEDIGSFFHGILSNQPEVNPYFYNWNTVVLTYCDGGLFSGNRDKPLVGKGKKYYFQGRKVLKAQLDSIRQKTEMPSGKQFVLSGTSAGGLALILQANYIRHFLPEQAKIRGLVDAGYFLDQDSVYNTSISNVQFKALYSLHRPTLSRACVEAQPLGKKFKCLFPQETAKHVKIPLFLVNSLYDHWQLSYLEGISCVYNNKCDRSSHDRILAFRNKMYSALNEASKWKNTTGVFANSCFAHGQVILDYTWSKSKVDGKTLSEAFHDWFVDDDVMMKSSLGDVKTTTATKRHVYADCRLPCNGSCPSLLASRCVNNFIRASPERRKRDAELC